MQISIRSILMLMLLLNAFSVFAQNGNASMGPAPIMKSENNHKVVNTIDNPASIAYGWEWMSKSTLSMPIPAGTPFTTLNIFLPPDGGFASSMTKGGDGNYYVITYDNPSLFLFNTTTGAVTLIGSITGLAEAPNGISYNPANGSYYLITASYFYSFNITTRVATLIGNMGILNSAFIDLCFNDAGACYAYCVATDASYIINPQTGAATLLGPLGFDASYGQDMSYDMETGTIYLSAYSYNTITGQLRTMDPGTGATTLLIDWGNQQVALFELNTQYGSPCTIGAASNPNPPSGSINIPISGNTVTWTNGAGTINNEVWFGSTGSVAKIYDGPAITSYALPNLNYDTRYIWWIISKNTTCRTQGLPWTFTTVQNPNLVVAFYEPFNNLNCWTPIGPFGQQNWSLSQTNNAGGSPPSELMLFYDPSFNGLSQIMSCPINSNNLYENIVTWRQYADHYLGAGPFIGLAVTYDGGVTSTSLWETQINEDIFPEERTITFSPASSTYQLIFYLNGNIFSINLWDIDDVEIDYIVPVELVSFTASVNKDQVDLNWITSTETNNSGFEVQRSNGNDFETISFVEGHGTTTETQVYSYTDRSVNEGKYSYRLKQLDFDGTFEYSNIIEVDVQTPSEFALEQNYPNPFNPSTKITFRLAADSKVNLTVFNVLGQEVATLIDANMAAGSHSVDFDGASLDSGVYFYKIKATGNDATEFVEVKKMVLMK